MNSNLIGDAGEYLVSYCLSRRGIAAALMNTGAKGVDILATDDGENVVSIQVKSSQGKSQPRQWIVGKKRPSASSHFFYVFCNIWEDLQCEPELFIVPSLYVKESVNWNSKVPLFKLNSESAERYLNNWDQILNIFSK